VYWNIVVKEKPTVDSPFFGASFLTASLRGRRMSMYIPLLTVLQKFPHAATTVNYTSEFWELFEVIM
jgi:hypothetical protein